MDITAYEDFPQDGRVYLVENVTDRAAFYVCDGEPIYAARIEPLARRKNTVETSHLILMLSAELVLVNAPSTKEHDYFDIIRLTSWDNERELVAFYDLCSLHAKDGTALSFEDFFYALSELFQPLRKQQNLDATGLYGELHLIEVASRELGKDLSGFWQVGGYHSKYDFSMPRGNIEVKASTGASPEVVIKHGQMFNSDVNYLAYVPIERNSGGESLGQLSERLLASAECFTTLRSQIELNKRLLRVGDRNLSVAYRAGGIRCYLADDIDCIGDVPDRVTQLSYRLNLAGLPHSSLDEVLSSTLKDDRFA